MQQENTIDIPRLRKLVEWVEEQDMKPVGLSTWEQDNWITQSQDYEYAHDILQFQGLQHLSDMGLRNAQRYEHDCEAAFCAAGKVVADEHGVASMLTTMVRLPDVDAVPNIVPIAVEAQRLLGLDEGQASALFASGNDADTIRRLAEEFAGERL